MSQSNAPEGSVVRGIVKELKDNARRVLQDYQYDDYLRSFHKLSRVARWLSVDDWVELILVLDLPKPGRDTILDNIFELAECMPNYYQVLPRVLPRFQHDHKLARALLWRIINQRKSRAFALRAIGNLTQLEWDELRAFFVKLLADPSEDFSLEVKRKCSNFYASAAKARSES